MALFRSCRTFCDPRHDEQGDEHGDDDDDAPALCDKRSVTSAASDLTLDDNLILEDLPSPDDLPPPDETTAIVPRNSSASDVFRFVSAVIALVILQGMKLFS